MLTFLMDVLDLLSHGKGLVRSGLSIHRGDAENAENILRLCVLCFNSPRSLR